jgi:subtilisin family serine protease
VGATGGGPEGDNNDYRWQDYTVNADGSVTANIGDSSGSNTGACVSIFAPGDDISYAMHSGTADYGLGSGTSFASPHAAALGARYIQKQIATTGARPTYQQVYEFLLNQAQTVVQHTTTHAGYWMCVRNGFATASATPCAVDYASYWMPQASNTSDARMLFWDEGACWP